MSIKLPNIIGHRGACGYAPENTLVSIHTAADMGVEWVEVDVKLTRDNVPILFHDDTLDRTTNGSGKVAETDWEDLKQLEAGSWFSPGFSGTRIPTLEDALEVVIERDLGLNLEIKPCAGREIETAEVALDLLSRYWEDHDRLLISSFQHVTMETARDMAYDWHRALLLEEEWPENWRDLVDYLDVSTINLNGNKSERADVERAAELELPILAYTINDGHQAVRLQSWGVDAFFTDVPDVLQDGILTVH